MRSWRAGSRPLSERDLRSSAPGAATRSSAEHLLQVVEPGLVDGLDRLDRVRFARARRLEVARPLDDATSLPWPPPNPDRSLVVRDRQRSALDAIRVLAIGLAERFDPINEAGTARQPHRADAPPLLQFPLVNCGMPFGQSIEAADDPPHFVDRGWNV